MNEQRVDTILSVLSEINKNTLSPEELVKIVGILVETVKSSTDSTKNLSKELQSEFSIKLDSLVKLANKLNSDSTTLIDTRLSEVNNKSEKKLAKLMSDVKDLIKQVASIEVINGKDSDPEYVAKIVLERIKLPTYTPYDLTGENVVDSINSLPNTSTKKIDAIHIRGIDDLIRKYGQTFIAGNRFLDQLVDVNVSGLSKDAYGRYILGSGSSGVGPGTANQIAYFDTTTTIASLSTATYPSLTELSYVKGVTSSIQTQLSGKQATITLTTTGTSGAATFVANTLNIPRYDTGAASLYVPYTGATGSVTLGANSLSSTVGITAPYLYGGDKTGLTYPGYTGAILGGTATHAVLDFYDNNVRIGEFFTASSSFNFFTGTNTDLFFFTNNNTTTSRISALFNGNVGVGTNAPSEKFEITDGTNHFLFKPATTEFTILGPNTTLTQMPRINFGFNGDADYAISYLNYAHDNIALSFDSYHNGTTWVSSYNGSNFAIYKNSDELKIGWNNSTTKGSTFGSFQLTNAVRFGSSGTLGIYTAPTTSAFLSIGASGTTVASFNTGSGVAPTSPNNGDWWTTSAHAYIRLSGVTYQLDQQSGGGLSWGSSISGTTADGLDMTLSNSANASAIALNLTAGNTQTNVAALQLINIGTSSKIQGLLIKGTGSTTSGDIGTGKVHFTLWENNASSVGTKLASFGNGVSYTEKTYIDEFGSIMTVNADANSQWAIIKTTGGSGPNDSVLTVKITPGTDNNNNNDHIATFSTTNGVIVKSFLINATNAPSSSVSLGAADDSTKELFVATLSRQHSRTTTVTDTNGSAGVFQRTNIINNASGTYVITSPTVSITQVVTQTSGTITHSGAVLQITQAALGTGAPIQITQAAVTSSHFRKIYKETGSGITLWHSDGTTPNGNLSGTAGDVCFNGASSQIFYCTGTTNWTAPTGGGSSFTWNETTGTSATIAVNNGYIANNAGLVTYTLPTTSAVGDVFEVVGKGAGGWKVAQGASQLIKWNSGGVAGTNQTTTGTGGHIDSTDILDSVRLVCTVANTTWTVLSSKGTISLT